MKKHLYSYIILFFFLGLSPFFLEASNENLKADSIVQRVDKIRISNEHEARMLVNKLYEMAALHPNNASLYAKSVYAETLLNYSQGIKDSSLINKINKGLALLKGKGFPFEEAMLGYASTLSYIITGDYAKSFILALTTLEQFKQFNDSASIAQTLNSLGNICYNISSFNLSKEYYHQAVSYTNPKKPEYYGIVINRYSSYAYNLEGTNKSVDSLLGFIPALKKYQDTGLLTGAYLNLGNCYLALGKDEQALKYFDTAKKLIKTLDNRKLTIVLHHSFAAHYLNKQDYINARNQYAIAKEIAEKHGSTELLSMILFDLSRVYEELGKPDSAYFYLKEYNTLSSRLINGAKAIEAYRNYISVYLEASQNKLTIISQEAEIKNRQLIVTILSCVGIVLLAIIILIVIHQQKRNIQQQVLLKEAENRELSKYLEQEKEIQKLQEEKNKLQEEKHKELIESKVREITSYSLLLSNKNNILQQIADLIEQIPTQSEKLHEVKNIVKNNLNTDNDWEDFMLHFDKVHPSFFNRLKQQCENLTENNLRLCAYFRIGMSTKQIAKILNVSPESIAIHRYRLKKKFNLGEDDNLDDFIRTV